MVRQARGGHGRVGRRGGVEHRGEAGRVARSGGGDRRPVSRRGRDRQPTRGLLAPVVGGLGGQRAERTDCRVGCGPVHGQDRERVRADDGVSGAWLERQFGAARFADRQDVDHASRSGRGVVGRHLEGPHTGHPRRRLQRDHDVLARRRRRHDGPVGQVEQPAVDVDERLDLGRSVVRHAGASIVVVHDDVLDRPRHRHRGERRRGRAGGDRSGQRDQDPGESGDGADARPRGTGRGERALRAGSRAHRALLVQSWNTDGPGPRAGPEATIASGVLSTACPFSCGNAAVLIQFRTRGPSRASQRRAGAPSPARGSTRVREVLQPPILRIPAPLPRLALSRPPHPW